MPYYKYEVVFTSGRTEKFRTSKACQALTNIECLNEDGTICGHLSINESLVESLFVKKVEPSITKEQQETLDWAYNAGQIPKQETEELPIREISVMGTDGQLFSMYVEQ